MLSLDNYMFTDGELEVFKIDYFPLLINVNLNELNLKANKELFDKYNCGVYFWVLTIGGIKYKIYIGKTNSIKRRLREYSIEFQIHSPNDFKMRFFQNFISKNFSQYDLSLYFSSESKETYTNKETQSIRVYKPMINQRSSVSLEQKHAMQNAFESYYESIFINKL